MATDTQTHDAHENGPFGPEMWVIPEPTGLTADVVEKQRAPTTLFNIVLYAGALLTVLGVVGFVLRLLSRRILRPPGLGVLRRGLCLRVHTDVHGAAGRLRLPVHQEPLAASAVTGVRALFAG